MKRLVIFAVIVCAPVAVPSVHALLAKPPLLLVDVVEPSVPPPLVTAQVTPTPETALLNASATSTVGVSGNNVPAKKVSPFPWKSEQNAGAAGVMENVEVVTDDTPLPLALSV